MINIIIIKGGLGNQMFCYAFYLCMRKKNKSIYLFNIDDGVLTHHGLELFKVFKLKGTWRYHILGVMHKLKPSFWKHYKYIKEQHEFRYSPDVLRNNKDNTVYDGYWQSYKYVEDIYNLIKKKYRFKKKLLNSKTLSLTKKLESENSVSVHVRRGDYMKYSWGTCSLEYYYRSISYITRHVENVSFYFFSDDIEWCKLVFNDYNYYFVNCNSGSESWQDMFLMTRCKHNIIANSTFSWWGAWLNSNPDKIVIAPSIWFNDRDNSEFQIIPPTWIKL